MNTMTKVQEGRDAPLYHWIGEKKLVHLLEEDVLLGSWTHTNPETDRKIKGTSLSRNKRFRWARRKIRIVLDQAKLSRTHRILPLDADLVANYGFSLKPADEPHWRDPRASRTKTQAKGNWERDFGEEFVLGDIKNAHNYIKRIDVIVEEEIRGIFKNVKKLARVLGNPVLSRKLRIYSKTFNIPIQFIPSVGSTQHLRMREAFLDDMEHRKELEKTGFWGSAGSGILPMSLETGRLLLPFRSSAVEQPHTWGGTWGGAIDKGQNPKESAIREFREESGYNGPIEAIPLFTFEDKDSGFKYFNFLGLIPDEFDPSLDWETDDYAWIEYGNWPSPMHFGLEGILKNKKSIQTIERVLRKLESGQIQEHVSWEIDDIKRLAGLKETEYSSVNTLPVKELAAFYNVNTGKILGGYLMTHADLIADHAEIFGVDPSIRNKSASDIGMMLDNNYRKFHEQGWIRLLSMRDGRTIVFGINGFAEHIKTAWKQKVIPQLIMKADPDEVMIDLEPEEKRRGDALFELPSDARKMKAWFEQL